jgi:hypothetical protein
MRKIFLAAFIFLVLLAPVWILAYGTGNTPIAVSPGSETGEATMTQRCPTFSWSAFDQAAAYRIAVFQSPDLINRSYEDMAGIVPPMIGKEIPGPALSWTLPAEERLQPATLYAWYVQAVDSSGNEIGSWSIGRTFMVEPDNAWAGTDKEMEDILKANGLDEEVIDNVMKDFKSDTADKKPSPEIENPLGSEGANNTFYGQNAGTAITSGIQNTFIGKNAGASTTSPNFNTFLGDSAGITNTTGDSNTFIGNHAGFNNSTGYSNAFLGGSAGDGNTTGNQNTFLGFSAGINQTTGSQNMFLGCEAGFSNSTGGGNTFLGYRSGYGNVSAIGNIFLGSHAGSNETGSYKLYIDDSDTASPLIYGDFSTDMVGINGWLGVGTQAPAYPIELKTTGRNAAIVATRTDGAINFINATTSYGQFGTVNNYGVRILANATWRMALNTDNSLTMASGATCTAGGVWTNASSLALKENITTLNGDEAATTLQSLNPVKYNYKADKKEKYVGFIAEQVPELVSMNDRKSLSTMDIVAVLTKVVQDQQKAISALQSKVSDLERKSSKEMEKEK